MRGHVSAETLAAFREDLLPRRKAARVSAHLAACPRCAGLAAQLAEVTALLARPAATPMPAALTARIEAALAAEAAARSAAPAGAVPATSGPVMAGRAMAAAGTTGDAVTGDAGASRPGGRGRRRADRAARAPGRDRSGLALRIAAVTAAVAILGGGGYGVARLLSGSPAVTNAASGAGAASNHRAVGVLPSMSGQRAAAPAALPGYPVFHSGTDYLPSRLGTQVRGFAPLGNGTPGTGAGKASHQSAAKLFPDLYACVARVAGGKRPVFVDVASYRGRPAAVIAVAGPGPGTLRVLIVGTGCNGAASDLIATTTLPAAP